MPSSPLRTLTRPNSTYPLTRSSKTSLICRFVGQSRAVQAVRNGLFPLKDSMIGSRCAAPPRQRCCGTLERTWSVLFHRVGLSTMNLLSRVMGTAAIDVHTGTLPLLLRKSGVHALRREVGGVNITHVRSQHPCLRAHCLGWSQRGRAREKASVGAQSPLRFPRARQNGRHCRSGRPRNFFGETTDYYYTAVGHPSMQSFGSQSSVVVVMSFGGRARRIIRKKGRRDSTTIADHH